jgi:hypothetical protein
MAIIRGGGSRRGDFGGFGRRWRAIEGQDDERKAGDGEEEWKRGAGWAQYRGGDCEKVKRGGDLKPAIGCQRFSRSRLSQPRAQPGERLRKRRPLP